MLFCIPKILKNESNSQPNVVAVMELLSCFVSQRYWKMKAIHNLRNIVAIISFVVLYPKDTEKWKQFTTELSTTKTEVRLFCIPKILKNESNSQQGRRRKGYFVCCFVSQRYWKMKAIHNSQNESRHLGEVVLYPKDTEKWKQFTTIRSSGLKFWELFCIPKILKNESNSQLRWNRQWKVVRCFVSQRYWKMKAIHNRRIQGKQARDVVLYPKDTEKWKQFTTFDGFINDMKPLFCIPKILKNESNSQRNGKIEMDRSCCFVSQRYWKMKAIHNAEIAEAEIYSVVLYPKDTEKWKQFTTQETIEWTSVGLFCIPKILKNESNSQQKGSNLQHKNSCFVSQRYWKMKAIHNLARKRFPLSDVVLYPKDTEKWKQFTT